MSLKPALGITGAAVSRKIYGQVAWTAEDLFKTADFFGVEITDLLPRRVSGLRVKKCVQNRGFSRIDL